MQSSRTIAITEHNFQTTIARPGVVVLDCSATWCAPCRVFAPVFAAAAARRPEFTWGTVDTEEERALAVALDIRAQPTIVVFRDGALVHKQVGAMSPAKFDELIERVTASTEA
jgi:thioredoxin 1